MRLVVLLLIIPLLPIALHYSILGLPCLNDAWIHLSYARVMEETGLLYGNTTIAGKAEYNFKWPLVNLLLYLAKTVVGFSHPQTAFLISFTAALAVVPLYAFAKRLLKCGVSAIIASVIAALLTVKPFMTLSVMKETAAQYPFYTFLLLSFRIYAEGLTGFYPLFVLSCLGLLLAHHYALLMALTYAGMTLITKIMTKGPDCKALLGLASFALLCLVTYAWYTSYLKAYDVINMMRAGLVITFLSLVVLLADYTFEPYGIRTTLFYLTLGLMAVLIALYAIGVFRPIKGQGFGLIEATLALPHIALMALAAYGLMKGLGQYAIAYLITAFASFLTPFLMGNTPLNLLFITKSLDFASPFMALAAVGVLTHNKRALYTTLALSLTSLPLYTILTVYAHLPKTSASLLSYHPAEYVSACLLAFLIEKGPLYSTYDFASLLSFTTGLKVRDAASYLVTGMSPHGVLILRLLNFILGVLYPGGYALTEISRKAIESLALENLVFNSTYIFVFYPD